MIKWQTHKKPSSHSIADVFPTEAAAWAAFDSIASSNSASQAPLYPESDHKATDPQTSLRLAAQEASQPRTLPSCEILYNNGKSFEVPLGYTGYLPGDQRRCALQQSSAFVIQLCPNVSVVSKEIHFSWYYVEQFIFRNFRLFLHCYELHVRPWLFGMQLATVCMSTYGPVYSFCTHQPKAIWEVGARWSCPKFHSVVALLHKEGVLCIICTVAGSDAIKWFRSSSASIVCTATASSESA